MAAHAQSSDAAHADHGITPGAALLRWTVRACALALLIASMWVVYRIVDGSAEQAAGGKAAPAAKAPDGRQAALANLAALEGRILSAEVNGVRLPALTERYVRAIASAEPHIGRIEARARLAAEAKVVAHRCPTCAKTLRSVRRSLG
jgi:hypothetical protein